MKEFSFKYVPLVFYLLSAGNLAFIFTTLAIINVNMLTNLTKQKSCSTYKNDSICFSNRLNFNNHFTKFWSFYTTEIINLYLNKTISHVTVIQNNSNLKNLILKRTNTFHVAILRS